MKMVRLSEKYICHMAQPQNINTPTGQNLHYSDMKQRNFLLENDTKKKVIAYFKSINNLSLRAGRVRK